MFAYIHLREGTHISHSHHIHSMVAVEVDNVQSTTSQGEAEDERGNDGTDELFQEVDLKW